MPHGHLFGVETSAQIDFRERVAELSRLVTAVLGVALSELSVSSIPPTFQSTVARPRARIVALAFDLNRFEIIAEIDVIEIIAHFARRVAELRLVTNAQLTIFIVADAFHFPAPRQSASVVHGRAHLLHFEVGAPVNNGEVIAHFVATISAVRRVSESELAVGVPAPALGIALSRHGARMAVPGVHSNCIEALAESHCLIGNGGHCARVAAP